MPVLSGARSPIEFEMQMNRIIGEMVKDVTAETLRELKDFVDEKWYTNSPAKGLGSGEGSYGEPTREFYRSLVDRVEPYLQGFMGEVFSDPNKIFGGERDGFFNSHMSVGGSLSVDGVPISHKIVEWIEEGTPSRLYSYPGISMFEETDKWLKKTITKLVKKTFGKYGIKIVKTK